MPQVSENFKTNTEYVCAYNRTFQET